MGAIRLSETGMSLTMTDTVSRRKSALRESNRNHFWNGFLFWVSLPWTFTSAPVLPDITNLGPTGVLVENPSSTSTTPVVDPEAAADYHSTSVRKQSLSLTKRKEPPIRESMLSSLLLLLSQVSLGGVIRKKIHGSNSPASTNSNVSLPTRSQESGTGNSIRYLEPVHGQLLELKIAIQALYYYMLLLLFSCHLI